MYQNITTKLIVNSEEGTEWTSHIFVPHNVDEILVKYFIVKQQDTLVVGEDDCYIMKLNCDLVQDPIVCSATTIFPSRLTSFINSQFTYTGHPINNNVRFRWTNADDTPIDNVATFHMVSAISISFIQH